MSRPASPCLAGILSFIFWTATATMEVTMPKPAARPDPDTPALKVPGRNRSWPEVQLPPFPGTVPYERALAAVRTVKERRTRSSPA